MSIEYHLYLLHIFVLCTLYYNLCIIFVFTFMCGSISVVMILSLNDHDYYNITCCIIQYVQYHNCISIIVVVVSYMNHVSQ